MLKRPIPTQRQLKTRAAILNSYVDIKPLAGDFWGLEKSNKKIGRSTSLGYTALVWNLPPVITCPGAGTCLGFCYNADTRADIFPLERWCNNLYWVLNNREESIERINKQIREKLNTVVRIHSSGDFFSNEYILLWREIVENNPNVLFWAYTRSWSCGAY